MSARTDRAKAKGELARDLAVIGGAAGSAVAPGVGTAIGIGVGGLTGLIVGDNNMVFPLDMVAIPAYQAYMIQGTPAATVYIKAGETLMATGGNVQDVQEGIMEANADLIKSPKKRRKKNPWIVFNKKFSFRAKKKSESSQDYLRKRTKAARLAYNKQKRGGK